MTPDQIVAILMLLSAFGVPQETISSVQALITPATTTPAVASSTPVATVPTTVVQTSAAPEQQTVQAPAPVTPVFATRPTTEVVRSLNERTITFRWESDVPTTATWSLCSTRDQCYVNYTSPVGTSHTYTVSRPANSIEFYKVELANGESATGQIPQ